MHALKQGKLVGFVLSILFVFGIVMVLPAKAVTPSRDFSGRMATSTRSHVPQFERFNRSQGSHLYGKVMEVFPDHVTLEISSGAFFGTKDKSQATERVNVLMSQTKQERLFAKKVRKTAVGDLLMVQGEWNQEKTQFTAKRTITIPADGAFPQLNRAKKPPVRPKKAVR